MNVADEFNVPPSTRVLGSRGYVSAMRKTAFAVFRSAPKVKGEEMKGFGPHSTDDLMIAVLAVILAWVFTLALRAAFDG